jgi:hypothetical protein
MTCEDPLRIRTDMNASETVLGPWRSKWRGPYAIRVYGD